MVEQGSPIPQPLCQSLFQWLVFTVLGLFFCIFIGSSAFAGAGLEPDRTAAPKRCIEADEQLQFAAHYFSKGEYDRAAAEYERFVWLFPDDDRIGEARYRIGKSWFAAGQFEKAKTAFLDLIAAFPESDLAARTHVDLSHCYLKLNDPVQALISLDHLDFISKDPNTKDIARYEAGWTFIESANWEKARSSLDRISDSGKIDYAIPDLDQDLREAEKIPQKNPRLSGTFSIVPGGGYLYCGRPRDALTAFLLNGGLIWAGLTALEQDNPALAGVIGFVEVGFYTGNIYGGISSAHKYNKKQTETFIEKLKRNHRLHLSVDMENRSAKVVFESEY
jgi:tetratricopeptide (TPR) repeat protein